jgi:hypothetical protein
MRVRGWCLLATSFLLGACASGHHRGWQGDNATPFDTAQADCDAKSRDLPAGNAREAAFDACMKDNGWRRP